VIGLIAGIIARFLLLGPNNPHGFILTAALGIAGAFVATWIGQSIGWYRPDQGAGFVGATVGAIVVLVIWHRLVVQRVVTLRPRRELADCGEATVSGAQTVFVVLTPATYLRSRALISLLNFASTP
jgi:uncharacterized membrane protein YeaQ/YmgE (transglycosylase-associated protein family)